MHIAVEQRDSALVWPAAEHVQALTACVAGLRYCLRQPLECGVSV